MVCFLGQGEAFCMVPEAQAALVQAHVEALPPMENLEPHYHVHGPLHVGTTKDITRVTGRVSLRRTALVS